MDYARHYGIKSPRAPGNYLTLGELFEMSLVNEVWVFGDADNSSDAPYNAAEILELETDFVISIVVKNAARLNEIVVGGGIQKYKDLKNDEIYF